MFRHHARESAERCYFFVILFWCGRTSGAKTAEPPILGTARQPCSTRAPENRGVSLRSPSANRSWAGMSARRAATTPSANVHKRTASAPAHCGTRSWVFLFFLKRYKTLADKGSYTSDFALQLEAHWCIIRVNCCRLQASGACAFSGGRARQVIFGSGVCVMKGGCNASASPSTTVGESMACLLVPGQPGVRAGAPCKWATTRERSRNKFLVRSVRQHDRGDLLCAGGTGTQCCPRACGCGVHGAIATRRRRGSACNCFQMLHLRKFASAV